MSSQSSTHQTRSYGQFGARMCYCGQVATITTSWSDRNPGRRYYHCPILNGRERACRYFDWAEPPTERSMGETSPAMINLARNDNGTNINEVLHQLAQIQNELGRMQVGLVQCMRKNELHSRLLFRQNTSTMFLTVIYYRGAKSFGALFIGVCDSSSLHLLVMSVSILFMASLPLRAECLRPPAIC